MTDPRITMQSHEQHPKDDARPFEDARLGVCAQPELSAPARERRASMLRELHGELDRTARGRSVVRWGAGAALVLLFASGVGLLVAEARGPQTEAVARRTPERSGPVTPPARGTERALPADGRPRVSHVHTDPSIIERLGRGLPAPRLTLISDDELVALASADGLGRGLVRCGSEVWLVPHEVGVEERRE